MTDLKVICVFVELLLASSKTFLKYLHFSKWEEYQYLFMANAFLKKNFKLFWMKLIWFCTNLFCWFYILNVLEISSGL